MLAHHKRELEDLIKAANKEVYFETAESIQAAQAATKESIEQLEQMYLDEKINYATYFLENRFLQNRMSYIGNIELIHKTIESSTC